MKGRGRKPLLARAREEKVSPPLFVGSRAKKCPTRKTRGFLCFPCQRTIPAIVTPIVQYLIDCPMCVNLALSLVTCGIIPPLRIGPLWHDRPGKRPLKNTLPPPPPPFMSGPFFLSPPTQVLSDGMGGAGEIKKAEEEEGIPQPKNVGAGPHVHVRTTNERPNVKV